MLMRKIFRRPLFLKPWSVISLACLDILGTQVAMRQWRHVLILLYCTTSENVMMQAWSEHCEGPAAYVYPSTIGYRMLCLCSRCASALIFLPCRFALALGFAQRIDMLDRCCGGTVHILVDVLLLLFILIAMPSRMLSINQLQFFWPQSVTHPVIHMEDLCSFAWYMLAVVLWRYVLVKVAVIVASNPPHHPFCFRDHLRPMWWTHVYLRCKSNMHAVLNSTLDLSVAPIFPPSAPVPMDGYTPANPEPKKPGDRRPVLPRRRPSQASPLSGADDLGPPIRSPLPRLRARAQKPLPRLRQGRKVPLLLPRLRGTSSRGDDHPDDLEIPRGSRLVRMKIQGKEVQLFDISRHPLPPDMVGDTEVENMEAGYAPPYESCFPMTTLGVVAEDVKMQSSKRSSTQMDTSSVRTSTAPLRPRKARGSIRESLQLTPGASVPGPTMSPTAKSIMLRKSPKPDQKSRRPGRPSASQGLPVAALILLVPPPWKEERSQLCLAGTMMSTLVSWSPGNKNYWHFRELPGSGESHSGGRLSKLRPQRLKRHPWFPILRLHTPPLLRSQVLIQMLQKIQAEQISGAYRYLRQVPCPPGRI